MLATAIFILMGISFIRGILHYRKNHKNYVENFLKTPL